MKNKNLALSREVIIHNALNESADKKTLGLTDGTPAVASDLSSWVDVFGGVNELFVDLGRPFSVCGFSVNFLHDVENLVLSPESVKLLLSENGEEFYEAAKVNAPYPASFRYQTKANYSSELSEPCLARFVKIRFCAEMATKCGELRIFGSESDGNELKLSGAAFKDISSNKFASPDSLSGIKDLPLVSFGSVSENGEVKRLKREELEPLIAYVDRCGNEKGEMFKSVALCQSMRGECPSGGCMTYHSDEPSKLSDWEFLIDELFADGANLKALNEEYSSVKTKLGLDRDKKLGVYLTVPMPKVSFETFGDLNGDGVEEKLLTTEDCISAFNWYVDAVTRRFLAECLSELKIEGFIWNNNRITREHRDDETYFVKECVSSLHDRGYKCVFVGTQFMSGVEKHKKIGFDCVTLSSSALNGEISKSTVSACKKYGSGINIPGPLSQNSKADVAAFVKDLSDCITLGLLNTVHTIDRANVFIDCARSEDETVRLIYDGLYEFINQNEEVPEEIKPCEEITVLESEPAEEIIEAVTDEPEETEITEEATEIEAETETETVEEACLTEKTEEIKSEEIESEEIKSEEIESEKSDFVPYEVPTLKIEISMPPSETECPDRKCGYCSKFQEQNKPIEQTEKIEQTEEKALPQAGKKPNKKAALAAAGVAVALGTAYLIAKSLKGNKNG